MSRTSRIFAALAAVAVVAVAAAAGLIAWGFGQPLPLPATPYAFDVKAGATLKSVARELVGAGILPFDLPLVALARVQQVDRSIKAGNYEVTSGITLPGLLDKLTQGDVTQAGMTVVEGSTFAEFAAALAGEPGDREDGGRAPGRGTRATDRPVGNEPRGLVLSRTRTSSRRARPISHSSSAPTG